MVHKRARVHGDEDGVGQVGEDDGESSRRPVWRARTNDLKASRLSGRSDTRRYWRFDWFDLKTGESVMSCGSVREGLTGLASKLGETGLTGFGLKTGGGPGAVKVWAEGTWHHHEVCVETKRSHEDGVFFPCFYIVINSVGIFLSSRGDLEDKKRGAGNHSTWSAKLIMVAPLLLPLLFLSFLPSPSPPRLEI
jgi:hypothetical protein